MVTGDDPKQALDVALAKEDFETLVGSRSVGRRFRHELMRSVAAEKSRR